MRKKKTAPHSPEHMTISRSQPSGLIAKANTGRESAGAEPALDNRSHRTRRARSGRSGRRSPAAHRSPSIRFESPFVLKDWFSLRGL
jgi:hypothetical protein